MLCVTLVYATYLSCRSACGRNRTPEDLNILFYIFHLKQVHILRIKHVSLTPDMDRPLIWLNWKVTQTRELKLMSVLVLLTVWARLCCQQLHYQIRSRTPTAKQKVWWRWPVPVQHDVIQCPPLYIQHVWVHGCALRLLQQQPHVVGNNALKKRACVLSLDLYHGPVRQGIADKPCTVSRLLAVSLHRSWRWSTGGYAQIPTGAFSGVNTETTGGCERSSGQTQHPHFFCLVSHEWK